MNFHDNPVLDLTRHKSTSRVNVVESETPSGRNWRMQPQFLGQYLCVYSIGEEEFRLDHHRFDHFVHFSSEVKIYSWS